VSAAIARTATHSRTRGADSEISVPLSNCDASKLAQAEKRSDPGKNGKNSAIFQLVFWMACCRRQIYLVAF